MADKVILYVSNFRSAVRANCAPVCLVGCVKNTEVLELLAFWRAEQQDAYHFRIWRPLRKIVPLRNQVSQQFGSI